MTRSSILRTADDLADYITGIGYGEMRSVAVDLFAMCEDGDTRKLEKAEDFADLLFDWAEANVENREQS